MGCEVFKEPGFIIKFLICIIIFLSVIVWHLATADAVAMDVVNHLGVLCLCAVFYFFFPEFIMMIMYGTNGFSDNLYELVVSAVGAVVSLFAGGFLCGYRYEKSSAKSKKARRNYSSKYTGDYGSSNHEDVDEDACYMCVIVFQFILCILFILDAVLNGAQKK